MDKVAPSRRGMLVALGASAALAAIPATSYAAAKSSGDRAAWESALEKFRRAKAEEEKHERTVWNPAFQAYERAAAKIPHRTITVGDRTYSTADERDVAAARRSLPGVMYIERGAWQDHKARQLLVDAADIRDRAMARLRERYNIDRLWTEGEQLSDARYEAWKAIHYVPAFTASMLAEKWDWILSDGDLEGWEDAITLDLARLSARERN